MEKSLSWGSFQNDFKLQAAERLRLQPSERSHKLFIFNFNKPYVVPTINQIYLYMYFDKMIGGW